MKCPKCHSRMTYKSEWLREAPPPPEAQALLGDREPLELRGDGLSDYGPAWVCKCGEVVRRSMDPCAVTTESITNEEAVEKMATDDLAALGAVTINLKLPTTLQFEFFEDCEVVIYQHGKELQRWTVNVAEEAKPDDEH